MNWTPEKIATLRQLWIEGCSAALIAKRMGPDVTKSMIDGKILRMGLKREGKATQLLTSHPDYEPKMPRENRPIPSHSQVWEMSDDERRIRFAQRAAKGARQTRQALEAAGQ
jgi:hypothetical protein